MQQDRSILPRHILVCQVVELMEELFFQLAKVSPLARQKAGHQACQQAQL